MSPIAAVSSIFILLMLSAGVVADSCYLISASATSASICPASTLLSVCAPSALAAQMYVPSYSAAFDFFSPTGLVAYGGEACTAAGGIANSSYWTDKNQFCVSQCSPTYCGEGKAANRIQPPICCSFVRNQVIKGCSFPGKSESQVEASLMGLVNPNLTQTVILSIFGSGEASCVEDDAEGGCFAPKMEWLGLSTNSEEYLIQQASLTNITAIASSMENSAPPPVVSPEEGTYENVVFISAQAEGDFSHVFYTTDGSDPSPATSAAFDTEVMVSLPLSSSVVFKAISIEMNGRLSPIVTKTYTLVSSSSISISFSEHSGKSFEGYGAVIVSAAGANALNVEVVETAAGTSSSVVKTTLSGQHSVRVFMGTIGSVQISATASFNSVATKQATATYSIVPVTKFNHALEAPKTCFANGKCMDLYGYIYDEPMSQGEYLSFCLGGAALSVYYCSAAWGAIDSTPQYDRETIQQYHASVAGLKMYVLGVFMSTQNALLRNAAGFNTPTSLLPASAFTASGIHVMNLNDTTQAYIRPDFFIYRGEPNYPGAPCPLVSPYQPGIQLTGTTREIWGFNSWSRSFEMPRSWFGSNRVLMMYKRNQDKRGGAFIYPYDLLAQYEVTYPPGTRVKSLACEQTSFSEVGMSGNIAVEYIYDVSDESEMSPADEAALLKTMRQELINANNTCWTASCQCSGISAAEQLTHDPNTPIPNSWCLTAMQEFLSDSHEGGASFAGHIASIGIVAAVAGVCALLLSALWVMRSRRNYVSLDSSNIDIEMK